MAAHKVPLKIDQGATLDRTFTWKAGDTLAQAVPVDLTGCVARAEVRPEIDSPSVLLLMTTENGRIILGGPAGTIRLRVEAVDTALLSFESAVYDLEVEFPDGTVVRRMAGTVSVSKEVTRGA